MALVSWIGTARGQEGRWDFAANWSTGTVPTATDDVVITGDQSLVTGLSTSGAFDAFRVDAEYTGTIGSPTEALVIDPDSLEFYGQGLAYINVGSANIDVDVRNTFHPPTGSTPRAGLYLTGSNIDEVRVYSGVVETSLPEGTSTIATLSVTGTDAVVYLSRLSTVTTARVYDGVVEAWGSPTTTQQFGGLIRQYLGGALTTITVNGGLHCPQGSGTITTLNAQGGSVNFSKGPGTHTVTTLAMNGGKVIYDPSVNTITNAITSNGGIRIEAVKE